MHTPSFIWTIIGLRCLLIPCIQAEVDASSTPSLGAAAKRASNLFRYEPGKGGSDPSDDYSSDFEFSDDEGGESHSRWSSRLSIDPAKVLSTLIRKGGLLLPKAAEKDLGILKQVMHVEESELNLVERWLVLHDFRIALPDGKTSLRIGRVFVRWDSYLKPCIDVEVDRVHVLVEFTNLMLTRNNWNELREFGFPPELPQNPEGKGKTAADQGSFVRFNSIDLSKDLSVRVLSRPLKKKIGTFSLDLDSTDEINELIRRKSDSNLRLTGRRGCTTTELAKILQEFIGGKVRQYAKDRIEDIASSKQSHIMEEADKLVTRASESVVNYAADAGRKKGSDIQNAVASKLARWGIEITPEKIEAFKERSKEMLDKPGETVEKEGVDMAAKQRRREGGSNKPKTDKEPKPDKAVSKDEVKFPDW